MTAIYDDIGINYAVRRRTDPDIARQLHAELAGATRILNIGAGTGSYELSEVAMVAVEPSAEMIAQRAGDCCPVKQASAESLPFESDSFSHAMTVNSMHHWQNRAQAFSEINRVAREKFVAVTWDPDSEPFWLTRDYFPAIYQTDLRIFPRLAELHDHFDEVTARPLKIPAECQDGLLAAFWKRPQAYLDAGVRQSMSSFAGLPGLDDGLEKLQRDLSSGRWADINAALLDAADIDVGYRLVTASIRKA